MTQRKTTRMRTRISLSAGESLVVRGPCSLDLRSGTIECFGGLWSAPFFTTLRPYKQYHFYAKHEKSEIVIDGARKWVRLRGDPIPRSWRTLISKVSDYHTMKAIVLGPPSAGKSTLTTFVLNQLLLVSSSVSVIDADPGQNEIGPPGTISLGTARGPVIDLSRIRPITIKFLGFLSPSADPERLNLAVLSLMRSTWDGGLLIINSDGWVSERGLSHKSTLVRVVEPDIVLSLLDEESNRRFSPLIGPHIAKIERPFLSASRPTVIRKAHRESVFRRYLDGGHSVAYDLKGLKLKPRGSMERGTLVGLMKGGDMVGVGILEELHPDTGLIRIFTKVAERIDVIEFGEVDLLNLLNQLHTDRMIKEKGAYN